MIVRLKRHLGQKLAEFLSRETATTEHFSIVEESVLKSLLQVGDVILVEGHARFSTAIKYLTQSTWSHACLYVGDEILPQEGGLQTPLIEADIIEGVIAIPLGKYADYNIRICRPIGITSDDKKKLVEYARKQIGFEYDLKNVIDLMRYLLPVPPVPSKIRRKLLDFGSGEPTKGICSTLIAQCFQNIGYPILPRRGIQCFVNPESEVDEEVVCLRPYTHFTPRDFDLSPYFSVVKPQIERGFNYKELKWYQSEL